MPDLQTIKVSITPKFNITEHVESLLIDLTIQVSLFIELCNTVGSGASPADISNSPSQLPDAHNLIDSAKLLVGKIRGKVEWIDGLSSSETVKMSYRVTVVKDDKLGFDPRGLNSDHGGVLGSGMAVIPPFASSDHTCRMILGWVLSSSPESTRAVWTFGEGPGPVEKVGSPSLLTNSVYMVGPIQSNPAVPIAGSFSDYYGYYWFGNLPPTIEVIKDIHHNFFMKVSTFFDDTPSAEIPYLSFVLNTSNQKSFGGTSFFRSHIFTYDDQIEKTEDYDLIRRMSHEIVHNFLGPAPETSGIDWLYQGIKYTLSIYLPFRNRFRTGDYFSSTLSQLCMKYYTNPLLNMPQDELLDLAPTNEYAKELLGTRAWAFVIGTDLRARKMAEMMRPIEDLAIKVLAKKRAAGEPYGIEEWIALLEPLMGGEIREHYEQMCSGVTILLPVEVFGAKTHRLIAVQQEILDFGMDRKGLGEGIVRGLREGSRAEEAGLREGDRVLWSSHAWKCVDHFEARMEILVERDEKEVRVEYWPRAYEKADSWVMSKVEE